jgi:hypothetical protein
MKYFFLVLFLLLSSAVHSANQNFTSSKAWLSSRWYVIAQWQQNALEIKNTPTVLKINVQQKCNTNLASYKISRASSNSNLEILQNNNWLLIEIQPTQSEENILFENFNDKSCSFNVPLSITFQNIPTKIKPYLFLDSNSSQYYGQIFKIDTPPVAERADVQLDVLVGDSFSKLNNVGNNAKSTLHLVPDILTRGEWVPHLSDMRLGLQGSLSQSLLTLGATTNQSLNISEISLGIFWERFFARMKGIQFRVYSEYLERTENDGSFVQSVPTSHTEMAFPIIGTLANFYFSDSWFAGVDAAYGLPTHIAGGSSGTQDIIRLQSRIGKRLTTYLFMLLELSAKRVHSQNFSADYFYQGHLGFRLDL